MQRFCTKCSQSFAVREADLAFLSRYSLPAPTLCPSCRQQRRAAFRNSRSLYRRECASSGKSIISTYSPDKPFAVYDTEDWWSDRWDGREFGRDFNFAEPFFPQFQQLMRDVPRPALFNKGSENCTFTNHAVYNQNCFLCFNIGYSRDIIYSEDVVLHSRDCCDSTNIVNCELVYDAVDCSNCYNSLWLIRCTGCSDSRFLYDCRGCTHCLLCCNLRNKSYCIENEQLAREEYFQRLASFNFGSRASVEKLAMRFESMTREYALHRASVADALENGTGNYLVQSRNIHHSFDVKESEDLSYCFDAWKIHDCMDCFQTMDRAEQQYETHASSVSVVAAFCNISHENSDILYTDHCFNSRKLFGCVGLRRNEYCILNQQFSPDDYEVRVKEIIEHMQRTGEFGQFFPAHVSPYGYNETAAADYFPLMRSAALEQGFLWCDYEAPLAAAKALEPESVPDDITDADSSLASSAVRCQNSGKLFRLLEQELELYRRLGVPIPIMHPDERYRRRLHLRDPRELREAACGRCGGKIVTSRPAGIKNVLCEACYCAALEGE